MDDHALIGDIEEVDRSLREASGRFEAFHAELLDAYPALRGSLAIPGALIGHGLGSLVANGMTDDQIVAQVLSITAQIREALGKIQPVASRELALPRCSG